MEVILNFDSASDLASLIDHSSMADIWGTARSGAAAEATAVAEILESLNLWLSPEIFRKEFVPATTGLFFDIGLVCSGIPECWVDPQPADNTGSYPSTDPEDEREIIRLGLNTTVTPSSVKRATIIERGASVIVLAYLLEQSGRLVSITQYNALEKNNYNFYGSVVLKSADQELNVNLLALWLLCPEVFRRSWFKLMAGVPNPGSLGKLKNVTVQPITDYGKTESDIFVSGIQNTDKTWVREDSLAWVLSSLTKLGINY
jgi:hypothetical protein